MRVLEATSTAGSPGRRAASTVAIGRPLTRLAASMMSRDCTIRTDKAQRELGYQPVISRSQGLKELSG